MRNRSLRFRIICLLFSFFVGFPLPPPLALAPLVLAPVALAPVALAMDEAELIQHMNSLSESDKGKIFSTLSEKQKGELLSPKEPAKAPEQGETSSQKGHSKPLENEAAGPSNLEKIMSGEFPTGIYRDLNQYGYDFFKNGKAFTPQTNVPVGEDYIIGPGDQFTVDLWGKAEKSYDLTVTRDGTIVVPRLGSLNVNGLSFSELKEFLLRKFKEYYPDFEMSITMGKLRNIEVFVVGEANQPATYSVSSLSTVITALYAAGGPSKNGSLRDIKVFRNGGLPATLDLYDFFIRGLKHDDIRLQAGDTIFIPVLGSSVGVAGAVRRPAIYEIKGEQTIGEVIELAGGLLPTGELQNVVVERIEGHKRRVIKSFNLAPSSVNTDENLKMPLKDFDVIKIYPIYGGIAQAVYLEGHVKYPREYELKPEMRILDIIPSYNSLLAEPYLPQSEIIRLMPPDSHPEIIPFDLELLLAGDPDQNLLLHAQDRIIIYSKLEKEEKSQITIRGAVRNPGAYPLYKGMTIKDLIFQAGNLTNNAYVEKATLSRVIPGKTGTELKELDFSPKKAMAGLSPDNMLLERDDSVSIREIPQYSQALEQKVYLEGEFLFPGEYTFSAGERISSSIEKAGGVTKHAYPFGARFYRESVKKMQEQRLKDYVSKLEEDILTMSSQEAGKSLDEDQAAVLKQTLESRRLLVEKLKDSQVTGRMVIDLREILADPSSGTNLELRAGDRLVIEKRPDTVDIMGEVYNPTAIFAEENKAVGYYLKEVGGITPNADEKQIYVVKANGSVISKTQETFFGMSSWDPGNHRWTMNFESIRLDPGDTIIVPKEVEKYPWMKTTKDITQILYQIAVGAGVIVAAY